MACIESVGLKSGLLAKALRQMPGNKIPTLLKYITRRFAQGKHIFLADMSPADG